MLEGTARSVALCRPGLVQADSENTQTAPSPHHLDSMRRIAFSLLVALSTATADTESSDADVTNLLQLINPQGPLPAQTGAQSQLYGSELQGLQRADFASTKWSSQSTPALNAEDSKPIIMTGRFGNLPPAVKNSGVTSQVSSQSSLLKQAVPVQAPTSLTSPTQPTQSLGSVASLAKLAELAELARLSSTKPRVREARVTGTAHKKGKKGKKLKREPEEDVELPKKSTELVPELSSEEVEPEPAELSSSKVKTSKSKSVLTDAAVSQASHGGAKRLHDLAAAACKDWLHECRSISTDFNVDACMHYKSFCLDGTPGLIEGSAMAVGQADHAVSKMAADIMGAPTQSPKKSAETADAAATAPSQADTVESKTLGDGISTGISQSGVGGFGTDREPETAPTASTESTDRVEEISKDALSPITEAEAAEVRKQGSEELEKLDESDESSDPQPEGLDAKTTSSTNTAEASAGEVESSSDVHELDPEVPATPEPSEFLDSGSAESDADTEEPSAAAETLESDQLDQPQVRPEAPLLSSTDSMGSTDSMDSTDSTAHSRITHSSISRSDRSDISDSPGTAKSKPMSNAGWVFGQAASTLTNNQEVDQGIQSTTFELSRVDALGASAGSLTLAQSEQEQERLASAKENLCALWHSMCRRVTTAEVCVKYASICH